MNCPAEIWEPGFGPCVCGGRVHCEHGQAAPHPVEVRGPLEPGPIVQVARYICPGATQPPVIPR